MTNQPPKTGAADQAALAAEDRARAGPMAIENSRGPVEKVLARMAPDRTWRKLWRKLWRTPAPSAGGN